MRTINLYGSMKQFISWASLLMLFAYFAVACSDDDFGNMRPDTTARLVLIAPAPQWSDSEAYVSDKAVVYECFHSMETLQQSERYRDVAAKLPSIDWEKQTLLIVQTFNSYGLVWNSCDVWVNDESNYVIDFRISSLLTPNWDSICCAVILNCPNISKEQIRVNQIVE